MNDIDARAVPALGGHYGEFRVVSRSAWMRVQEKGDDAIFDTAFEAETMAWRAAKAAGFGFIRADIEMPTSGPVISAARAAAEKLFRKSDAAS
ncbi:MAG: hypothetical protein DI604_25075 [Delftia acidovorans]|nr:MAG: hypothetical protein DI604_25075 [Delftia acidovorans]